jgi:tellurium resistance protein TerD
MTVSLTKGGNVSLEKIAPTMSKMVIGLGWSARVTDGFDFDLDASLFLLGDQGRVLKDNDFIFYNNAKSACNSVEHTGDNLTGEGTGDDESIKVDLSNVPSNIERLAVAVTIHDAALRQQNFGQVSEAYIRIIDEQTGSEVCKYDLTEDYSTETAMTFGEVYRHNGAWKFKAIGQGFQGGLKPLAQEFGVNIG